MNKKILSLVAVVALVIVAVVGGTLAYFTDTDSADNVFTVGNVDIQLNEDFDADSAKLLPGDSNAITKEVSISVAEGSEDTYVWYEYLVPAELEDVLHIVNSDSTDWTYSYIGTEEVDGVVYNVYLALYKNVLAAGEETDVAMTQVYLDSAVDADADGVYTLNGETIDFDFSAVHVIVRAYGIQAAGFSSVEAAYAAF